MKDKLLAVCVGIALLLGGYATFRPAKVVVQTPDGQVKEVQVGGVSDGNIYNAATAHSAITQGGYIATSSTLSSLTMAARELMGISTYSFAPGVTDFTLTLPASSTLTNFIPRAGDNRYIVFQNATGTNGIDLTLAGNTGMILRGVHGTSTILYDGMSGVAVFTRAATTSDIYVELLPQ